MAKPHLYCATRQLIYFASSLGYRDATYLLLLAAARCAVQRGCTMRGFVDRCLRAKARAGDIESADELDELPPAA
jgi:hypothetical protein